MKTIVLLCVFISVIVVAAQHGLSPWATEDARGGFDVRQEVVEHRKADGTVVALVRSDSSFKQLGGVNAGVFQTSFVQQRKAGEVVAHRWFIQLPFCSWKPL